MTRDIQIKRAYLPASRDDGTRVLIDRIWPRGLSREVAAFDGWAKDLAPSVELRRWFKHDPDRFIEFSRRYRHELQAKREGLIDLLAFGETKRLTLIYGARDEVHNHAVVLAAYLKNFT